MSKVKKEKIIGYNIHVTKMLCPKCYRKTKRSIFYDDCFSPYWEKDRDLIRIVQKGNNPDDPDYAKCQACKKEL